MESVYGRIVKGQESSKNYKPIAQYAMKGEGDDSCSEQMLETGATKIFKHTTSLREPR